MMDEPTIPDLLLQAAPDATAMPSAGAVPMKSLDIRALLHPAENSRLLLPPLEARYASARPPCRSCNRSSTRSATG